MSRLRGFDIAVGFSNAFELLALESDKSIVDAVS
jgi:hypothetical protein